MKSQENTAQSNHNQSASSPERISEGKTSFKHSMCKLIDNVNDSVAEVDRLWLIALVRRQHSFGLLQYHDLLDDVFSPRTILRIESHGENFAVEKHLLTLGVTTAKEEGTPFLVSTQVQDLALDRVLLKTRSILTPKAGTRGKSRSLLFVQTECLYSEYRYEQ